MKYAVISDIHANLEALTRVIDDARNEGVEKFVCLGDVVGYGPNPAKTIYLIRELCDIVIAGNHDDAVSGRLAAEGFIDLAGEAVTRHKEALSQSDMKWLKELPWACEFDGAIASHGDVCDPPKFYYVEDENDAKANFEATRAQLIFVGHTHVPAIFLTGRSGNVYHIEPQDFTIEEEKRYIVNPGSVGYPREKDGKCHSTYVIYDSDENTISYRYIPFSVASVMQRGSSPKRIKKRILALCATMLAIITTLLTICMAPAKVIEIDPALVLRRHMIPSLDSKSTLKLNLQLDKKSDKAQVTIFYYDKDNRKMNQDSFAVAKKREKKEKLPGNVASAEIIISQITKDSKVKIMSFSPTVSEK